MPKVSVDDYIARLARLFLEHPVWIEAAKCLSADATSTIFFSHKPGQAWHLENCEGKILLLPGAAEDPDFVFRFTPATVQRLEGVDRRMDDFAVELDESEAVCDDVVLFAVGSFAWQVVETLRKDHAGCDDVAFFDENGAFHVFYISSVFVLSVNEFILWCS